MHLVLMETSGNQAYIFATNKLRENVGASELTYRAGTQWVLEAVQELGGPRVLADDPAEVRRKLLDPKENPPVERSGLPIEVILAASGKALLLVQEEAIGREIVSHLTRRALKEAPGLDVRGAISSGFDFATERITERIHQVYRRLEVLRGRLAGPVERFARLPVVADCSTSGLPAARYDTSLARSEHGPRSAVSLAKQSAAQAGLKRIGQGVASNIVTVHGGAQDANIQLPRSTNELENLGCEWLAVIHADGNGLGEIFMNFDRYLQGNPGEVGSWNRAYIDQLRRFSLGLDNCTEAAFCRALASVKPLQNQAVLPVLPLILGGDDLTVVCDGRQALRFAHQFIIAFEEATRNESAITLVMRAASAGGASGVTCCVGVAIVKPHFPFHAAYELAEELLQSAKKIAKDPEKKRPAWSAIDFHILYDSSSSDLERIRRRLEVDGGKTVLVARPYVASPSQGPVGRRWSDLEKWVGRLLAKSGEDGRPCLPRSMLHNLREGLFFGSAVADHRMRLVLPRYANQGLNELLVERDGDWSLFWKDESNRLRTGLLDAMDVVEFW